MALSGQRNATQLNENSGLKIKPSKDEDVNLCNFCVINQTTTQFIVPIHNGT